MDQLPDGNCRRARMAVRVEVYQPANWKLPNVSTPESWKELTFTTPSYETKKMPFGSRRLLEICVTVGAAPQSAIKRLARGRRKHSIGERDLFNLRR